MDKSRELHLFIIWNKALPQSAEILEDIKARFTIQRVYNVHWSDKYFSDNMSRFYGQKLLRDSFKEAHCGRGPFIAALVVDEDPNYEVRQTSRGQQVVNVNCFDAKELYRNITGGGHRIHGTNSAPETDHDLILLLGQDACGFLASHPDPWDGQIEEIERDLSGAGGWDDLSQLFRTLNAAADYAVLRNFEQLPESATVEGHGDIDLLCPNSRDLAFVANGTRLHEESFRVLHHVKVGGRKLLFDFRSIDENYYDPRWARDMLARRVFSPKGFYHLSPEDYFYSLFYHVTVHKPSISPDYIEKLLEMPSRPAQFERDCFSNPGQLRSILDGFLGAHQYRIVEPNDFSVFFNSKFTNVPRLSVQRIFANNNQSLAGFLNCLFEQPDGAESNPIDFQEATFRTKRLAPYFSPNRALFLESLNLPASCSVLEIGAESGVLTRWMGTHFQKVTALEGDREMSRVVENRCRDLDNVRVRNVKVDTFNGLRTFDLAVAIASSPVKNAEIPELTAAIRCAKQSLKKGGLFILGVEATASVREEVVARLRSYGFAATQFLYAYPDATLPRVIFSEKAIRAARKSYGYWAAFAMKESDRAGTNELQIAGLSAQGHLDETASSCYILASREAAALQNLSWHVYASSAESRHPTLRATTRVTETDGGLVVQKRGTAVKSGVFQFTPVRDCPLFEGHPVSAALMHSLQAGDLAQFLQLQKTHARELVRQFSFKDGGQYASLIADGDTLLSGDAIDAIPQNAVIHDTSYSFFDLEWRLDFPIPLSYLMFRGLSVFLLRLKPAAVWKAFDLERYGIRTVPTLAQICTLFVNSLALFGQLKPHSLQYFAEFDRRFESFILNARYASDGASLFEKYHRAIALHADGDYEASQAMVDELRSLYPEVPEPYALVEASVI